MHIALFSLPLGSQHCNYLEHLIKPWGSVFLPLSILLYCLHITALNQLLVFFSRWFLTCRFLTCPMLLMFSCHIYLFLFFLSLAFSPLPRSLQHTHTHAQTDTIPHSRIYFLCNKCVRNRPNSKILDHFFTSTAPIILYLVVLQACLIPPHWLFAPL